ncbi:hypothetical protein B7C51_15065 [Paenibacillus larvae subsp. pulvifaciens]|uniref:Uncharacterized protein n=1 Tax=Paenibacillus larvae subsp. pulvifaciens TaxID=1477 RepID=A0A1V0UUI8_9BACL|nr:hypothetical protein [Paenibacillus larvae]ARF68831.1 hypothetical protein B7C51_15065 [Paenibacillus larvae subsp. pulvifaciens]
MLFILLFGSLIRFAFWFQSHLFIYAASAVPLIIVLLLPSKSKNQLLQSNSKKFNIRLERTPPSELAPMGFLFATFHPDLIDRKKSTLYIKLEDAEWVHEPHVPYRQTLLVEIAPEQLRRHGKHKSWIGIPIHDLSACLSSAASPSVQPESIRISIPLENLERINSGQIIRTRKKHHTSA